jgi:polysaccharide biosynthesis transport protein
VSRREVSGPRPLSWRTALVVTLVVVGLGAVSGGLWGWRGDARAQATAVILVNPLEGSPFSPEGQGDDLVNLETEAQLVTSDSVTGLVVRQLGLTAASAGAVRTGISVAVPTNTQLLRIRATNRSAATAIRRAQAFAEIYLDFRRSRTESLLFDRNARINEQLQQLGDELTRMSQQLSDVAPRSPRGLLLQQQITELTNRIGNLHTQLVASQSASTDPGQVVTPAAQDVPGMLHGPVAFGAVGAVAALVLAGLVLMGRGRVSPALRHPDELEHVGVPVLPRGDQLAGVRARILAAVERRPLVVQLASTAPWPGRAATAVELGMAFGRANLETILVELVESPRGPEERAGLTDLLHDRLAPDEALEPLGQHLQLLSPGTESNQLDDLVAGVEMSELLTELRKRADVILLSGGPIGDGRTKAAVRLSDLTVLEVPERWTTVVGVEQSIRDVEQSGGVVAGLVYVPTGPRSRWPW